MWVKWEWKADVMKMSINVIFILEKYIKVKKDIKNVIWVDDSVLVEGGRKK